MPHQPRKRFGQNFLIDKNIVTKIILAIHPQADDNIVEIGPGKGALTYPLLEKTLELNVIEIDRDLCETLSENKNLSIHCVDALKFDFAQLSENQNLRVVGNLPYNISTPLLFHLFEFSHCINDMYFMLQKEVVDRLCAKPNNKNYGRLSVVAQYYADINKLFDVGPDSFRPAPKVISSIVKLKPRNQRELSIEEESLFPGFVKLAFSQRRKTLKNNLKELLTVEKILECDIDPSARAETLDLDDFMKLFRRFNL